MYYDTGVTRSIVFFHAGEGTTCEAGHNDTQMTELQPLDSPSKMPLSISDSDHPYKEPVKTEEDSRPKAKSKKHGHGNGHGHGHGHSHHGHCHSDQEMKDAGIASIAWMVIMGDGMHNFSDGLAIGQFLYIENISGFVCLELKGFLYLRNCVCHLQVLLSVLILQVALVLQWLCSVTNCPMN